jgi:hypothetical protein
MFRDKPSIGFAALDCRGYPAAAASVFCKRPPTNSIQAHRRGAGRGGGVPPVTTQAGSGGAAVVGLVPGRK